MARLTPPPCPCLSVQSFWNPVCILVLYYKDHLLLQYTVWRIVHLVISYFISQRSNPQPYTLHTLHRKHKIINMMSWSRFVVLLVLVLTSTGYGQPVDPYYQEDFANDNLYHDYAARQQEKLIGAPKYVIWSCCWSWHVEVVKYRHGAFATHWALLSHISSLSSLLFIPRSQQL